LGLFLFLLEMGGIAHSTSSHSCVISTGTLHLESRVVGAFFLFAWEGLNYLTTVMTGHFNGNSINVRTFSMRASGLCDFRIFLFVFGFGLYFLVFNIFFLFFALVPFWASSPQGGMILKSHGSSVCGRTIFCDSIVQMRIHSEIEII